MFEGWRSNCHKWACGLEIQAWGFAPIDDWAKIMMDLQHVVDEDDSARRDDSNAMRIIRFQVVVREK